MTTTYLLDSSVLIPLMSAEHVHHSRASAWAASVSHFAICPVVEGAVVRFAVRLGARAGEVQHALRLLRSRPGFEFWSDSVSYVDVDLSKVRGHSYVTDAYLVGLAVSQDGILATLDEGIIDQWPDHALLIPA